ncbi:hypothetical protein SUGI_0701870 [Cryptomeria japonica]|nr:hypothetical protein SUGI_0701870 [Cryptomeria japonica]
MEMSMSMNPWLVGSAFGVIWEDGRFALGLCLVVMADCEKIKLAHDSNQAYGCGKFLEYPPMGCYKRDESENLNPKDDGNNSSFRSKVGFANEIILLYHIDLGKTTKKLCFEPDKDSTPQHPAGSRFGAHVATFESLGPQTHNCIMNEGGSTMERLIGGLHNADSVESILVNIWRM